MEKLQLFYRLIKVIFFKKIIKSKYNTNQNEEKEETKEKIGGLKKSNSSNNLDELYEKEIKQKRPRSSSVKQTNDVNIISNNKISNQNEEKKVVKKEIFSKYIYTEEGKITSQFRNNYLMWCEKLNFPPAPELLRSLKNSFRTQTPFTR